MNNLVWNTTSRLLEMDRHAQDLEVPRNFSDNEREFPTAAEKTARSLGHFTSLALVAHQLSEHTPAGVARELNSLLHLHEALPESYFLTPAVLCHEVITNSYLECGMLIAQLREASVARSCFALGRVKEPLPWRAQGLTPLEFVCLAVESRENPFEYDYMLSTLARLAEDNGAIAALRNANDAEEMLLLLERFS